MNNYSRSLTLFIIALLMVITPAYNQTLITDETFDEANGSRAGFMSNGEPWDASVFNDPDDGPINSLWGTFNGDFRCRDVEGFNPCTCGASNPPIPNPAGGCGDNQNIILFGPIDISAFQYTSIVVDLFTGSDEFECFYGSGGNCPDVPGDYCDGASDQIIFEHSIDGAPWVIFEYYCGEQFCFNNATACSLEGSTMDIRIRMGNQGNTEEYLIHSIEVWGTNAPIVNAEAMPTTICEGETIQLFENAGQVNTWDWDGPNGFSSSQQNPIITNATAAHAGTYTVSGADGDGCINSTTVDITVVSPPNYNVPSGNGGCAGFTLPTITGSNLTGNESYFSGPGGTGTQYNVGDVIPDGETVYIYDPTISATCNNEEQFMVNAAMGPMANTPTDPLMICYTLSFPPSIEENIADIINQITGGDASLTVNWYNNAAGTGTPIDIANPSYWIGQLPPPFDPLFATVDDGTCESATVSVQLVVEETPTANDASADICELATTFDLTTLSSMVNNTGTVVFYSDAALTNPIANPSNYTVGPTTLFAAVETAGGCSSTAATITLNSQPAPQIDPIPNQNACGSFSLPTITGSNITGSTGYFTSSGGVSPISGPITSSMTIFAFADNGGGCTDEVSFTVIITPAPDIAPIADVTACGSYTLPPIPYDANPSGNGGYYTQPNEQGILFNPGDVITTTTTLFAFDGVAFTCFDEVQFTVTITSPPDLQLLPFDPICAGESIDLSTLVTDNNSTGLPITFHNASPPNAGNELPSSTVMPTTSTSYFANSDGGAGCSDMIEIPIVVNPLPIANMAGPLEECATNGNTATFDLTQLDNTISGGSGAVTWYQNAAPSNMIGNPSSFTTGTTTVFAVVNDGNCDSAPVAIQLNILPTPTINPAGPLEECATNGNMATFDLTQLNNTISGGSGTVNWFTNAAATQVINNPSNFTTGSTTVFVVVTDGSACSSAVEPIQLIVNPTPTANPVFVSECGNPTATFNLINLNNQVGGIGGTVNWFTDAAATQPIPTPNNFVVASTTIVFATYTFNGCTSLPVQVTLDVTIGGNASPTSMEACDLGGGQANFDLTTIENTVNNGSGEPVNWFLDNNTTQPITTPSTFFSNSTTVFAIVGSGNCTSAPVAITLTVLDNPTANDMTLSACDNGNGTADFNLTSIESQITTAGNTIFWSLTSNEPFIGISNPSDFNSGNVSVFALISNGNCSSVAQIMLNVSEGAALQLTQTDEVSCFGAMDANLDLTLLNGATATNFVWTPSTFNGLEDPQNVGAGIYSVTVTDQNMCTSMASITVTEPDAIVIDCNQNEAVSTTGGNDGSAIINITGGTLPYTIDWDGAANGSQQSNTAGDAIVPDLIAGNYNVTITDANDCTATCQFTINEPGCDLSISLEPTHLSCNNANDGQITTTLTGGQAGFTFAWSPDLGNTQNPTNLAAGDYSVTVTDANNCMATASVTLINPPVLTINCTVTNHVTTIGGMDGQASIDFSGGTSPYTIEWSGAASGSQMGVTMTPFTMDNLGTGTYDVTITDANDCSTDCQFIINEPGCNVSLAAQSVDVLCNGDSTGSISLTINGAQDPVNFQWSPDLGNTANPTNLAAGTYEVTATDANNCTASTSIEITAPNALTMDCMVANHVSTLGGMDGQASIDFTGGTSPYTIEWSGAASGSQMGITTTPFAINTLGAGTYDVTLTDANDCTIDCQFTINEPGCNIAIEPQSVNVLCNGDTTGEISLIITGAQDPVNFQWSPDLGNTANPTNLAAGTYEVTATDANNCTASTSIEITAPNALTMDCTVANHVSTPGGMDGQASIDFTGGTPPYTIEWSGAASGSQMGITTTPFAINTLGAGTYDVTLTDANDCTIDCQFTINEPGCNIAIEPQSVNVLCNGDTTGEISLIITGAQDPVNFQWSPDLGNTANPTNLAAGTYEVTATDANNCTASTSIEITAPNALTMDCMVANHVSTPGGMDGQASIDFTGGTPPYTIEWSGAASGSQMSITTTPFAINNLSSGAYDVTITDTNNCSTTCQFAINEPGCNMMVSALVDDEICSGDSNGQITLEVINGADPLTIEWNNSAFNGMTILTGLSAGNYNVTITDNNNCVETLDLSVGTANPLPTASLFEGGIICPKDCFDFNIAFTGTPPFNVNINLIENGIATPSNIVVFAQDTIISICGGDYPNVGNEITLEVVNIADAFCFAPSNASASLFIRQSFETTLNPTLCNGEALEVNGVNYDMTNPSGQEVLTAINGCDSIINIDLNFHPLVTSSVNETLCANEAIIVNGTTYDSSNPTGVEVLSGASSTGCDSTVNINLMFLPQIEVSISGDATICPEDNTPILVSTNSTSSLELTWMIGSNQETGNYINGNVLDVSPSTTTTYSIINATDNTGCPVNIVGDAVTVTVEDFTIDAFVVQDISCADQEDGIASVNTTPGPNTNYTYSWSNGGNQATIDGLGEGTYEVEVNSSAGCTQSDEVTLTAPSELTVNYTTLAGDCNGNMLGALQIDGVSGGSGLYEYMLEGVTPNFTGITGFPLVIDNLPSGQVTLVLRDDVGCTEEFSIFIPQPQELHLELGEDQTINAGDFITLTGIPNFLVDSLVWSPTDSLLMPDQLSTAANPTTTITYHLTAFDAEGCSASDAITIYINQDTEIFVPSAFSPNDDGTNDVVMVFANQSVREIEHFAIFDRWGNKVFEAKNFLPNDPNRGWDGDFQGKPMNPAVFVYYVEYTTIDNRKETLKGDIVLLR